MAYVKSEVQIREQRIVDIEYLANIARQDIRPQLTFLPGLVGSLALLRTYVEDQVREFYATVQIAPDHSFIHYALARTDYRVTAQRARETLGLRESKTRIHELCYLGIERPRHPQSSSLPLVEFVAPCYKPPFTKGSSRALVSLTCHTWILDVVMRKTLLPRPGFHKGFTCIQQWLVAHLVGNMPQR